MDKWVILLSVFPANPMPENHTSDLQIDSCTVIYKFVPFRYKTVRFWYNLTRIQSFPVAQICDHDKVKMQSVYRGSVKFIFRIMGFFNLTTGRGSSARLLPASYCLLYLLLLGCCLQEENKKDIATMSEANKKVVNKTRSSLN
jgi:hypothetical protein